MNTSFLLYGSYGYTGALIAELAVKHGHRPVLAGRDATKLKTQAGQLGLEYRAVSLEEASSLEDAVKKTPVVLHCAGPFKHTSLPMVNACLRMGRHYLDITGEIRVFEALVKRDAEARENGVMLLPGVGFDVVPTDCLAMHLKERLPGATSLSLAINTLGAGFSRGTTLTLIEDLSNQGVVRKDGKLISVPLFGKLRQIEFSNGTRTALRVPWGDVSTAYYSTHIPNIEDYVTFPLSMLRMLRLLSPLIGLAAKPVIQRWLKQWVKKSVSGPSGEALRRAKNWLWGEVIDDQGHKARAQLETPDGYNLTAETALRAVERALGGDFKPGFQTPSLAYGADFVLECEGVTRQELQV